MSLISGIEKFSAEEGYVTNFCDFFLSHGTEKFLRGIILCFRKYLVSKNVRDKRGGGYHDFPSKLFCLTLPIHFVEEPLCVSESFGYRKILWKGG